jgi:hypothetical protein
MTPPLPPLAQLHRAEAQTADAIRAAAHAIDTQAGALLPAALAELSAACDRARQRVQEAREEAQRMVAGLLTAFDEFTAETLEALEHSASRAQESSPPAPASPQEAAVSAPATKAPARKRKGAVSGARVSGAALADLPPEAPSRNGRKPALGKAGATPRRALAARGRVGAADGPGVA